ncbi:unnamed protein product [Allacma fusca]|uniref:Enoyl reductase (ER) domain-containing protein n=1 Tax=Allacma fusca TaxID=39272 RepID=A0A8J2PIF9_9HEXA|nr:unnamed protein product [Allacma fusca]
MFHKILIRTYTSQRIIFSEFGNPANVLKLESYNIEPENGKVLVKMLASPVNPADLNVVQGVYPLKPKVLPDSPGAEGVGVVTHSESANFKEGDWVLPLNVGFGLWKGYINLKDSELIKIDKNLGLITAATIQVNPPTALRMLTDFEKLQPGDTVIQNGGTSGVGRAVIQLCAVLGLKSISIIRNRSNLDEVKAELKGLGDSNTVVLTEEEFREQRNPVKCQLALNCVSGKSVIGLIKALDNSRTLVTYGGMSKQPLVVPTSNFIFNDVQLKGFWMARWRTQSTVKELETMFSYLGSLFLQKKLVPPKVEQIKLTEFQKAVVENSSGKYVLVFD